MSSIKRSIIILIVISFFHIILMMKYSIARTSMIDLPPSLIDLKGGLYTGTMGNDIINVYILPNNEKKGSFLIFFYLPKKYESKVMTGFFDPDYNTISLIPRILNKSKDQLVLHSEPDAIIHKNGTELVVTPQTNNNILKNGAILNYYDSQVKILNSLDSYIGSYYLYFWSIFGGTKNTVIGISSEKLANSSINESNEYWKGPHDSQEYPLIKMMGHFRIYIEMEGIIIFRPIKFDNNNIMKEGSSIEGLGVLINDGYYNKLFINSELNDNLFDPTVMLYKY